jgi:diacylglycerol kinase
MVNTALEKLADHLHPGRHEQVRIVKDVAAGAVLWAAAISVVVGAIVFGPKLLALM